MVVIQNVQALHIFTPEDFHIENFRGFYNTNNDVSKTNDCYYFWLRILTDYCGGNEAIFAIYRRTSLAKQYALRTLI